MVEQYVTLIFSAGLDLGPYPEELYCPSCQRFVVSETFTVNDAWSYLACLSLAVLG